VEQHYLKAGQGLSIGCLTRPLKIGASSVGLGVWPAVDMPPDETTGVVKNG